MILSSTSSWYKAERGGESCNRAPFFFPRLHALLFPLSSTFPLSFPFLAATLLLFIYSQYSLSLSIFLFFKMNFNAKKPFISFLFLIVDDYLYLYLMVTPHKIKQKSSTPSTSSPLLPLTQKINLQNICNLNK